MPQASPVVPDKCRHQIVQRGIGDPGVGLLDSVELALGQSAASLAGTDITEATTTGYTEISATGGYARKTLTPGTDYTVTTSAGIVTLSVASKQFTPSGASFDDFDQVLVIATIGGIEQVWTMWPTAAVNTIVDGQPYNTGAAEVEVA